MKYLWKQLLPAVILIMLLVAIGCGGGTAPKPTNPTQPQQKLVDPSGNWKMSFVDASGNTFILSALFAQTGAVVTSADVSEIGNGPGASPPTPFACQAQTDISISNGLVQNVNQFSGTLIGNFGTLTFTSTLNDAGTHTVGTYTLTPGTNGNCANIAASGTFTGDEVPSMNGAWTGTVTCTASCPAGSTTGTMQMTVTQNDSTGVVNGTYVITGLPGLSSGTIATASNDLLSGSSWVDTLTDQNGAINRIVGGPINSFGTPGLGIDRSFGGNLIGVATYAVTLSH